MKFAGLLTASLMIVSLAGCCCGRNVVMDSCDPCGGIVYDSCGGMGCDPCGGMYRPHRCGHGRRWLHKLFGGGGCGCNQCCGSCGCDSGMCYGDYGQSSCAGCGAPSGSCGAPGGMMMGSDCGCSQPSYSSPSTLPGMATPPTQLEAPSRNAPLPAVPSQTTAPEAPPAPTGDTTMIPPSPSPTTQMVSYEEFQRLPGTVISGPGSAGGATTTNVGSALPRTSAAPMSLPAPAASRPINTSQGQQALWTPAKGY